MASRHGCLGASHGTCNLILVAAVIRPSNVQNKLGPFICSGKMKVSRKTFDQYAPLPPAHQVVSPPALRVHEVSRWPSALPLPQDTKAAVARGREGKTRGAVFWNAAPREPHNRTPPAKLRGGWLLAAVPPWASGHGTGPPPGHGLPTRLAPPRGVL